MSYFCKRGINICWNYGGIFILSILEIGCALTNGELSSRIVERSKAFPPIWSKLETEQFHQRQEDYLLVVHKNQIVNISLGIKQGQLYAKKVVFKILHRQLNNKIEEIASKNNFMISSTNDFESLLERLVEEFVEGKVQFKDIYFEKIEEFDDRTHKIKTVYHSYYLLGFNVTQLDQLWADIGERLDESRNGDLRALRVYLLKK